MIIDVNALPGIEAHPIEARAVIKLATVKSTMSRDLSFNCAINMTATI